MADFLEYSEATHEYAVEGVKVRSVTQILDQAGLISQFCRDEEARFRGSMVHEFCANDDIERLDLRTVPGSLRGYVRAWRAYRHDTQFSPTAIEQRVDCKEWRYAGRFDRFGKLPHFPLPVFLDIKTSKAGAIADYVRLQLVAYAHAYDPTTVFGRVAVSLRPDGRYNAVIYPLGQFSTDRAEWLSLVNSTRETLEGKNVRTNNTN